MVEFSMIIKCKWCWSGDDHIPGGNAIELNPLPIVTMPMLLYSRVIQDLINTDPEVTQDIIIEEDRQKELIYRHGWVLEGDLPFCCEGCRSEYLDEKNINDEGGEDEDD